MNSNVENQILEKKIKEIIKKMVISRLVSIPGTIMIGLAIVTIYTPPEELFVNFFADMKTTYTALAVGAAINLFVLWRLIKLRNEAIRLSNNKST